MSFEEQIREAAKIIKDADALLITAGAGMGVDSGLPDFRGTKGFWRAYPVIAKLGLSFEKIANPSWFENDPGLAWAFYGHRLNLYRKTIPHRGFPQLLEIGGAKPHGYFVFTSNVDGQFQEAGFSSERIVECHGSIHHFQCTAPCSDQIWAADEEDVEIDEKNFRAIEPLPKCRFCHRLARPNVLMFGDGEWLPHRTDLQRAGLSTWLKQLAGAHAHVAIIEAGAGSAIPTVRYASERALQMVLGRLVRLNPREPEVPSGQIGLPLGAAEGLQRILECLPP